MIAAIFIEFSLWWSGVPKAKAVTAKDARKYDGEKRGGDLFRNPLEGGAMPFDVNGLWAGRDRGSEEETRYTNAGRGTGRSLPEAGETGSPGEESPNSAGQCAG